jgi:hypothetical protein
MANEFSRNIQDADFVKSRALTASDGSVASADLDLGTNSKGFFPENTEVEVLIPALTSTQLASADTLTILLQGGAATGSTTSLGLSAVLTGTGSAIPETSFRFRLPSPAPRYVNAKFTTAGTTGDMSAKTAFLKLLF